MKISIGARPLAMEVAMGAVVLAFLILSSVACRTAPNVADPEKNYGDSSFRIHAPSVGQWVKVKMPEGMGVAFRKEELAGATAKAKDKSSPSMAASAQFGDVSLDFKSQAELFDSIKLAKIAQASFGALTPIQNDFKIAKFKTADCLMFKQKMNDAGKKPAVNDDLILYVEGMTCLHPKNPKKFVNLEFSQKYPRQSKPLETGAEEMSFFNSLTFR